jgi:hypothetical protein
MPYKDPAHESDYKKLWHEKNRGRAAKKAREWREKNPLRHKFLRAAKLANSRYPGVITADELAEIAANSGYLCYWCSEEEKTPLSGGNLTFEHLKPVNDKRHIVISCLVHNCAKVHLTGGIRKTDAEKLEHQQELERRSRERNAEKLCLAAHERYLKNQEITRLRAALRHAQGLTQEAMREYTKTHREEARERARLWRLAHPKQSKAAKRKCYLERRPEIRQKMREYYEQNKEKIKARARQYYEENKVAISVRAKQYKAARKAKAKAAKASA